LDGNIMLSKSFSLICADFGSGQTGTTCTEQKYSILYCDF